MTQTITHSQPMQYLSVHDIVWINRTITGETLTFDYVTLEEAMAAQYSYGHSTDVAGQAANLLLTLVRKRPFRYGNLRTAYIAVAAYLTANGYTQKVDDEQASAIVRRVAANAVPQRAEEAMAELAGPADSEPGPGVTLRVLVAQLLNAHADAVRKLVEGDE